MWAHQVHDKFDIDIASSVINGRKLIIRGTPEWDRRELIRQEAGCICMSFGTISNSNISRGATALFL
jgi:hypothetical protein